MGLNFKSILWNLWQVSSVKIAEIDAPKSEKWWSYKGGILNSLHFKFLSLMKDTKKILTLMKDTALLGLELENIIKFFSADF